MNKICCACLQLRESTTAIDFTLRQRYAVLTRLQVTEDAQVLLCHNCEWLLKKSYTFAEKCRVARVILGQWDESDCSLKIDVDDIKKQDVYQQNKRLFMADLGNSEIVHREYLDVNETNPEETVTIVEIQDILKTKTSESIEAQEDDHNNEADKSEDAISKSNSTELISLNGERANNKINFDVKNLNYDFEGDNMNEYCPNNLESELDIDITNEKTSVLYSKIDPHFGKLVKTSDQNIKCKTKMEEINFGFESVRLSKETQREDLKSRRKDLKYLNSKFRCHNCAVGFVYEDSYKMHMSRHEESNGKYQCEVCTLRFATRSGFCMHRAVHSQRFRCCFCLEVVKKCQYHRARCRVKVATDTTVKCSLCGKVFVDSASMERHVQRQHTESKRQTFQCEQCNKTFAYLNTLRSHSLLHETTAAHTCRVCDRNFVTHRQLAEHAKSHVVMTGSFYCTSCDVTFKNAKSHRVHYARSSKHASPEQYTHSCVSCEATYTNARDLRAHAERNHSTDVPYRCVACNMTYACRKTLGDHYRRVHGPGNNNQSFVCEFCGKVFKAKSILQKHVALHLSERTEISKLELAELNTQKKDPSRTTYTSVSIKELNVMDSK